MKLIFAVLYVSWTMGLTRCYKTKSFFTFIENNNDKNVERNHSIHALICVYMTVCSTARRPLCLCEWVSYSSPVSLSLCVCQTQLWAGQHSGDHEAQPAPHQASERSHTRVLPQQTIQVWHVTVLSTLPGLLATAPACVVTCQRAYVVWGDVVWSVNLVGGRMCTST